jgi:hypothetical protein
MSASRSTRRRYGLISVLVLISMLLGVSWTASDASAQKPVIGNVTTPKAFFGYDIGQDYKVTPWQTQEQTGEGLKKGCVEYMRELERTSNRVRTFEYGVSEMGKPMVLMVITSPQNWAQMDKNKEILNRLADPRKVASDDEARALAAEGKAVFWAVATIHSSERTATEVLLRLGYKLAANDDKWTRDVLDNLVVILETSISPDGIDLVDNWYYDYMGTQWANTRPPIYNKYVGHDNNRDFLGLALAESQANTRMRFEWDPTVYTDLHQTKSMIYMSPGPDPTFEGVNPITMQEWIGFAGHNMAEMSAAGWVGIYTYEYADMWYPGYNHGFSFMHNTNGRFYETRGAAHASPTTIRNVSAHERTRSWFNPNPITELPFEWTLMDAVNMVEAALMNDLEYTLINKDDLLYNFYMKGKQNMEKATSLFSAYIVPADGGDNADVTDMLNNLLMQGAEIHRAAEPFSVEGRNFAAGDYVILMGQPYGLAIHELLKIQQYPPIKTPYDVTAWTYGLMRDVETVPVAAGAFPPVSLIPVTGPVPYDGQLIGGLSAQYLIEHGSNNNLSRALPRLWGDPAMAVSQVDAEITVGGQTFPAGSFIVDTSGASEEHDKLAALAEELGLTIYSIPEAVSATPLSSPRIGLYTSNNSDLYQEGWTRLRLEKGSEFDWIQLYPADVVNPIVPLVDQFDVIVVPDIRASTLRNGSPNMPPGYQLGLGTEGVANLKAFAEAGGTLVLMGKASDLAMDAGWPIGVERPSAAVLMAEAMMMEEELEEEPDFGGPEPTARMMAAAEEFNCPGSLLRIEVDPAASPVGYGYDGEETVWGDSAIRWWNVTDPAVKVVAWFPDDGDLLLSGYLTGGDQLRGKATVVDTALGAGRVILLGPNTVYRAQVTGTFSLFFNSLIAGGR